MVYSLNDNLFWKKQQEYEMLRKQIQSILIQRRKFNTYNFFYISNVTINIIRSQESLMLIYIEREENGLEVKNYTLMTNNLKVSTIVSLELQNR